MGGFSLSTWERLCYFSGTELLHSFSNLFIPYLFCPVLLYPTVLSLYFFFMLRIVNFWSFFHHLMQSLPLKVFVRIPSKTPYSIRLTHWRHMMVDGAKFWIICKRLKLLRKAGCLQNSTPSTIVWHQCDIGIPIFWLLCFHKKMQSFLFHLTKAVLGSRADKAAKLL